MPPMVDGIPPQSNVHWVFSSGDGRCLWRLCFQCSRRCRRRASSRCNRYRRQGTLNRRDRIHIIAIIIVITVLCVFGDFEPVKLSPTPVRCNMVCITPKATSQPTTLGISQRKHSNFFEKQTNPFFFT